MRSKISLSRFIHHGNVERPQDYDRHSHKKNGFRTNKHKYRVVGTGGAQGTRAPPIFWETDQKSLSKLAFDMTLVQSCTPLTLAPCYIYRVLWVSADPVDDRNQPHNGIHPQEICSSNFRM